MVTSRSEPAFDVVVVGAGPAGLSAAVRAGELGARVAVLDAGTAPGGQYWRHPAPDSGPLSYEVSRLQHDLGTYRLLTGLLDGHDERGTTTYLPEHHVWTIERRDAALEGAVFEGAVFAVHAVDRAGGGAETVEVTGRRLVLATGAYDRQIPFPGWDLPGVMTAGGVQALLKGHGVPAGRRILVAGTGPFLLPVAAGLVACGVEVAGVHESGSPAGWLRGAREVVGNLRKVAEAAGYVRALRRGRVPVRTRSTVLAAHGRRELESVTLGRLDADGGTVPGSEERVEVDTLAVGWGFTPQLELLLALGCETRVDTDGSQVCVVGEHQETSVPGVFAAGEPCGVGGAELAWVEGVVAGTAAAGGAGGAGGVDARLARRRTALRRFAAAMHHAHPVPAQWAERLEPDTVVCRCEEVSVARLRTAVDALGAQDARGAKLLVRPGMGWCQGRVCGYATACLTARWSGTPYTPGATGTRPIATPIPLGRL